MEKEKEISEKWRSKLFADKIKASFGTNASLVDDKIELLKKTSRSSIWKLEIIGQNRSYPIILKIFTSSKKNKNQIELNIYQQANQILRDFMPQIYFIQSKVNDKELWVFMEYVQQLQGQIKTTPNIFNNIIPTVAKLHAYTFEEQFFQNKDVFNPWLPQYESKAMKMERNNYIERTKVYLDKAMKRAHLKETVKPYYTLVQKILKKGPDFFPELIEEGQSIIHGDLHVRNISCNNINENEDWHIQFIDWETAQFASGWFDMAVLVEILMDFRKDWHKDAEDIRNHCVNLYISELKKHGITFKTDPMKLYKMAYLQRTLEKGLLTHLRRELEGRPGKLLSRYLEKINIWGKELGLIEG